MAKLSLSGVVLAAGRSTRMGRDKALLESHPAAGGAQKMWERQHHVLRAAGCGSVYLSARPEQAWVQDAMKGRGVTAEGGGEAEFAAVLHDTMPGCGPLVGITAALERAVDATHVAVLAIDLPRLPAEWLATLWRECAVGVGVVGREARGERATFFEPLAAIYPREAMWLAWEALARGEYALQAFVRRAVERGLLQERAIAAAEETWFENLNEPRAGG